MVEIKPCPVKFSNLPVVSNCESYCGKCKTVLNDFSKVSMQNLEKEIDSKNVACANFHERQIEEYAHKYRLINQTEKFIHKYAGKYIAVAIISISLFLIGCGNRRKSVAGYFKKTMDKNPPKEIKVENNGLIRNSLSKP
jgi:hypothetical protein